MNDTNNNFFDNKVLGHPAGLFVLFFTEMWERFSYYGMRALLVLFLISSFGLGGWEWPREHALSLYGTYTALVYITPILGGWLADKYMGYRWAVVVGALIMTLGHASMAIETHNMFLYIGIGLLIIGNGFFKPNMTSIISEMYKDVPEKKDGAYTIFYMGVNAGAFLGILLCGYLGEKVGWSYGFGLAGIFMLLGMFQFYFTQKIFGDIGKVPQKTEENNQTQKLEFDGDKLNPFTIFDLILIVISAAIGVIWVLNDPISKISGNNLLAFGGIDYSNEFIIVGLIAFLVLLISRILRYPKVTRDRMIAIVFFAIMTVIFWMSFEQAGGSMNIFASDYTDRIMQGNYYYIYLVVNILITIVPLAIISWVLLRLFKVTFKNYKLANLILGFSFIIIWGIVFWMINRDLNSSSYVVEYNSIKTNVTNQQINLDPNRKDGFKSKILAGEFNLENGESVKIDSINYNNKFIKLQKSELKKIDEKKVEQNKFDSIYYSQVVNFEDNKTAIAYYTQKIYDKDKGKFTKVSKNVPLKNLSYQTTITKEIQPNENETIVKKTSTILDPAELKVGTTIPILDIGKSPGKKFKYLNKETEANVISKANEKNVRTKIISATVKKIKDKEVEIPATWFLILNSLFIIAFAPLFSKWWESKYNPNASSKYGIGLILLGIGFGALAFGSLGIEPGAKTAAVSLIWLVLAYLFHTLGELCLSPVALSYVSKLVPGRMIAMMFGVWYIAVAIGNKLAGLLGSKIDHITEQYDMTTFFLIFTIIPIGLGLIGVALGKLVNKLMHGIR